MEERVAGEVGGAEAALEGALVDVADAASAEEGAAFGPLVADATQGCLLFETWLDDVTPVPADKEGYYALLESNGIVRLPNPSFVPPPSAPDGGFGEGDRFS